MTQKNLFIRIFRYAILSLTVTIFHARAEEVTSVNFCGTHWPPFTYSENGKITKGLSFDIYTEAFKRLNIRFEAHDIPWARCMVNVESGKYDGVFDNNVKSPHFIDGKNPNGIYPVAIYVRSDFAGAELDWNALHGKKVGLVRGYEYPESIKLNKAGFIPDESKNDSEMIRKLKAKRYDYVVSDVFSILPLTKQEGVEVKMLKPLLGADNLFLTFNKDRSQLMNKFDNVLGQMIKDGTVDSMYKKYLPYTYHETMTLFSQE